MKKAAQISIAVAGTSAAILASAGVVLTTYAASSPFPDGQPTQVDTTVGPSRGLVPAEDRTPAAGEDHGRHRGHAMKRHHHGREAERGDDRGVREAEPGDDRGAREAEPGDDRGAREAEPGDDRGGEVASTDSTTGDDSISSGPGSTSSGSGSDDDGHHSGGDDSGSGGHGSDG